MSPPIEDAITILLVEPNPGDARLFSESFKDANIASDIHTVTDGEAALDFVYQRNDHAESPRPDMILQTCTTPMSTAPISSPNSSPNGRCGRSP